jgi:hypothetical protein
VDGISPNRRSQRLTSQSNGKHVSWKMKSQSSQLFSLTGTPPRTTPYLLPSRRLTPKILNDENYLRTAKATIISSST